MPRAKPNAPERTRPMPPDGLVGEMIAPAEGMREWVMGTFIREGASLRNPDHAHLLDAPIEFLWAGKSFTKQSRVVIGQAEELTFRVSGWQRWRQEQQIAQWFGWPQPAFLVTLAADYCREASDTEFCALVEHELYHVAHKADEFGAPRFTEEGRPKLGIRGHDVEEFVGVVERYGMGRSDGPLARLVAAANKHPAVRHSDVAHACGTCLLRVA